MMTQMTGNTIAKQFDSLKDPRTGRSVPGG